MTNRKHNISTLLWAVTLPPGPGREWKIPLCTVEEKHLPFYKGHAESGKSSLENTQEYSRSQEQQPARAELLKLHPKTPTSSYFHMQVILYASAWHTKEPIKHSFFNGDLKFLSFHTLLEIFFLNQYLSGKTSWNLEFFFQPRVKFTVLQHTNIPSSAWNYLPAFYWYIRCFLGLRAK